MDCPQGVSLHVTVQETWHPLPSSFPKCGCTLSGGEVITGNSHYIFIRQFVIDGPRAREYIYPTGLNLGRVTSSLITSNVTSRDMPIWRSAFEQPTILV